MDDNAPATTEGTPEEIKEIVAESSESVSEAVEMATEALDQATDTITDAIETAPEVEQSILHEIKTTLSGMQASLANIEHTFKEQQLSHVEQITEQATDEAVSLPADVADVVVDTPPALSEKKRLRRIGRRR